MDKQINRSFISTVQNCAKRPLTRVFYAFLPYDETTGDVNPSDSNTAYETRPVVGVRRISVFSNGNVLGLHSAYEPELGEQVVWTVV
jgi:hypothetical protein